MSDNIPRHIAVIMDGNGRWAKERNLPRVAGHQAGVETTRRVVRLSSAAGVEALTLFAFSSENWRRPAAEVNYLFELFFSTLGNEIQDLHKNQIRFNVIGDQTLFSEQLKQRIANSMQLTAANKGMTLTLAVNYGGRWDITQACQKIATAVSQGEIAVENINEALVQHYICLSELPEPDLFIRTSGEQRISNFLLWQLSYSELYFPKMYWPDFDEAEFNKALDHFASRQRRFGYTGEQVEIK